TLYVTSIRASERTGDLAEALSRYLAYDAQVKSIQRKLVSAAIYPVMLLCIGGVVTLFLLGYVVPRFSLVYKDIGRDLPLMSRLLISWGEVLAEHPALVLLCGTLALAGIAMLAFRAWTSGWVRRKLWSMPTLGPRIRLYELARSYRTMGMLLNGG